MEDIHGEDNDFRALIRGSVRSAKRAEEYLELLKPMDHRGRAPKDKEGFVEESMDDEELLDARAEVQAGSLQELKHVRLSNSDCRRGCST